MFKNLFSFEGRIRRTEYGLSSIAYVLAAVIISGVSMLGQAAMFVFVFYIPMMWIITAQGAKRCHDRGNSGWYQLIPFYSFWMLFAPGDQGDNEYGVNPKEREGVELPIDMVS